MSTKVNLSQKCKCFVSVPLSKLPCSSRQPALICLPGQRSGNLFITLRFRRVKWDFGYLYINLRRAKGSERELLEAERLFDWQPFNTNTLWSIGKNTANVWVWEVWAGSERSLTWDAGGRVEHQWAGGQRGQDGGGHHLLISMTRRPPVKRQRQTKFTINDWS